MEKELYEILSSFGYLTIRQGSLGQDEEYPDSLFTFWNYDTPDAGYYDNEPTRSIWTYYIYFYSNDPELVATKLKEATKKLKEVGWIIESRNGYDCASDVATHTGKYTVIHYVKGD